MDFSFIIPVYNCAKYLKNCVDSILNTGISSLEILLVDDGSTDGTSAVCDALREQFPQIRVIHRENAGVSAARNAGICAATGDYLLFADADDTLDSAMLAQILADPICRDTDLTIFGMTFDYYRKGICYRSDPLFYQSEGSLSPQIWAQDLPALYQCNALSSICNKIFKRDILVRNHLFLNSDMFLYEDLEFVLRYLSCCSTIRNIAQPVYHYRQSEDEGNAGRRLSRIHSIPELLIPIENALQNLCHSNPDLSSGDCEIILQELFLLLAREKIAVSTPGEIRKICLDYAAWENAHLSEPQPSRFRDQLLKEKIFRIRFHRIKNKLRHCIAVAFKATRYRISHKASP